MPALEHQRSFWDSFLKRLEEIPRCCEKRGGAFSASAPRRASATLPASVRAAIAEEVFHKHESLWKGRDGVWGRKTLFFRKPLSRLSLFL